MKLFTIGAVLIAAMASMNAHAGIKVGDKAPALKVAKWSKGKPIAKFEKGQVYVVEFWATWCGPCKTSIPHLTELAKKYKGKVTFAGISVWETDPAKPDKTYVAKVDKFVKDMGSKMDYNVGVDDLEGTMAKTWMEAAGQDGIPAAFVVDGNGVIAWIGHPMQELDTVLEQVVSGKYDIKAAQTKAAEEAKARAEMEKQQKAIQEDMGEVMALIQKGDTKAALPKLDAVIAKYPQFRAGLYPFKFNLLLEADEPEAYKFAKKMSESDWKDDAQMLNQIAWTIVEGNPPVTKPDYDVAIALAQRGVDITKDGDQLKPMVLDTLAYAQWKKGDKKAALTNKARAVELLKDQKDIPDEIRKEITDRYEMFKKG